MGLDEVEGFVDGDGAGVDEEFDEGFDCCDGHGEVGVFGEEAFVSVDYAGESESEGGFGGELKGVYSKSWALPAWGTLPTVAILLNAGGWPESGGGVVLPSKERFDAVGNQIGTRLIVECNGASTREMVW